MSFKELLKILQYEEKGDIQIIFIVKYKWFESNIQIQN